MTSCTFWSCRFSFVPRKTMPFMVCSFMPRKTMPCLVLQHPLYATKDHALFDLAASSICYGRPCSVWSCSILYMSWKTMPCHGLQLYATEDHALFGLAASSICHWWLGKRHLSEKTVNEVSSSPTFCWRISIKNPECLILFIKFLGEICPSCFSLDPVRLERQTLFVAAKAAWAVSCWE